MTHVNEKNDAGGTEKIPERANGPRDALVLKAEKILILSGKNRMEKILSDPQAKEIIQMMAEEELYFTFKELGDRDALPLLELASSEQREYFTDLELWQKDSFNTERALDWAALLLEAGPATLKVWLQESSADLLCLLLRGWIRVYKWDRGEDTEEPPFFTLDRTYYVQFRNPRSGEVLEKLLTSLAELDLNFYHQVLEDVIWEVGPEIEERELHFRTSRLAEKGFPEMDEALAVYVPLSPENFKALQDSGKLLLPSPPEGSGLAPAYTVIRQPQGSFFAEALHGLVETHCLDRIRRELATLANRVLVADGITPEDAATLEVYLSKVGGYISIGLERLVSRDVVQARELVSKSPLTSLFQVGLDAIIRIQRQAEDRVMTWLRQCGLSPSFLGDPWNAQLSGLVRKRPKRHSGGPSGEPLYEDFSGLEQIRQVQHTVNVARLVGDVILGLMPAESWAAGWRGLSDRDPEQAPLLTWRTILLSAFARGVLSGNFFPERLTLAEVRELLERIWEPERPPPRLAKSWRIELGNWLADLAGHEPHDLEPLVEELCRTVEEELGGVAPENLETRYLETLFLLAEESSP